LQTIQPTRRAPNSRPLHAPFDSAYPTSHRSQRNLGLEIGARYDREEILCEQRVHSDAECTSEGRRLLVPCAKAHMAKKCLQPYRVLAGVTENDAQ